MLMLLDIDDTLVDHSSAEKEASIKFGQQYENDIPDYEGSEFPAIWKTVAENHIAKFLSKEITFQEQRRRRIKNIFKSSKLSDNDCDNLFQSYLNHYEKAWSLFSDVIEFLEKHSEFTLGVLSDGEQHQQEKKLEQMGILIFFDFVLTAESTGLSKPDARFFNIACDLANCRSYEAYYIGDNLKKDAIGAQNAGLNGVWLNRNNSDSSSECRCIKSLLDF